MTYEENYELFWNLERALEWVKKNKGYNIFRDPFNTWVDKRIKIGKGTLIYPGCVLIGITEIGERCIIWPNTVLINTILEDEVEIGIPLIKDSRISKGSMIGSTAEINRSTIGNRVNVRHHSYLGDTQVGDDSNIGAGTITANFDGKNKNKTALGARSFTGVNSNLIAPNEFPEDTYIAAGTTVPAHLTYIKKVPPASLIIARPKKITVKPRRKKPPSPSR